LIRRYALLWQCFNTLKQNGDFGIAERDQLDGAPAKDLFAAIASIRNAAECRSFLRDLCTLSELTSMIERFQAARLLQRGLSYREISQRTGSSTATITRVSYWLRNGAGGYEKILNRVRKRNLAE